MLTIGQLAEKAGLRTSALRYYEEEGLLIPDARSQAGYRLYGPEAVQRLRLIQRAQRLGFSLADIRTLLEGWTRGDLSDETLLQTAEQRYLALQKQITEQLVLQHELERFLQDLRRRQGKPQGLAADSAFERLLTRVCADPRLEPASSTLDWLMEQTDCRLTSAHGQQLLARLGGQHVHVWQEDETYNILIVSDEADVAAALRELAAVEAGCEAHALTSHELVEDEEGYLLRASGPNAFIFARLFLALEHEST